MSLAAFAAGLAMAAPGGEMHGRPELLLENCVYLLEQDGPARSAAVVPRTALGSVLLRDGAVVAAGPAKEIAARAGRSARRVDVRRGLVLPGLVDAHGHVISLGLSLTRLNLVGTRGAEEVVARVAAEAKRRTPGDWILGRGWDQNDWTAKVFPSKESLDAVAPDHPVWLTRIDGHAAWANAKAIALAGVSAATKDPEGGKLHRAADGSPTGIFVDNAMELVRAVIPKPSREEKRQAILRALPHLAALGLTCVHDAGISPEEAELFRGMATAHELPVRVFAMLGAEKPEDVEPHLPAAKVDASDGVFRVFGVKAYADGALGSRGAALLAPYADDPGNSGLLLARPATLVSLAQLCLERGYQLCVHAIGDRGNRVALDAFEKAAGAAARLRTARFRVEHAQVLAPTDIPRFGDLGVIASMQPVHCTSDMPWAPDRLGAERVAGAYAWRRVLEGGGGLCLGSDFPVEDADPLAGVRVAMTTQDGVGHPEGGYRPTERLTIWEAIEGFTSGAAKACFETGRDRTAVKAGESDLTVLDSDITRLPADRIGTARVALTIVDGRVVYERAP